MSNYIQYKDGLVFHPGYYIEEIIDESGFTQEDFAKRLGTTPKNLSLLVRGKQNLSFDVALKLSKMLGTSIDYWLNLQSAFDAAAAEMASETDMKAEIEVVKKLNYSYFVKELKKLPALPRNLKAQVSELRRYLGVSDLCSLKDRDLAVSFRGVREGLSEANIIKANAMVQIAANQARFVDAPAFNKEKFADAIKQALDLTSDHDEFLEQVRASFREAGVVLVVLPKMPGSKINGATKKLASNVVLMVNNRGLFADTFWFTLLHEVGHIMNGDLGVSFAGDEGEKEEAADKYAQDALIDPAAYADFCERSHGRYTIHSVEEFASSINRAPGIVVGRLQKDGKVRHNDRSLNSLKCQYKIGSLV